MKKTNLFAVLALAATPAFLHAQTNYSDVVGYQSRSIASGSLNIISVPFVDAVVVAKVSSATTNSITLEGQSSLGALYASTTAPGYVEVVSGNNEGERFDISLAGISSATGTLTISTASANNTSSFPGTSLVNQTVALRKHTTLNSFRSGFSPSLQTGTSSTADLVYLFVGTTWTPFFLNTSTVWTRTGNPGDQGNSVIAPGSALMLRRVASTATTFTASGSVRPHKFAKNYKAGLGLYSGGFPIAYSPSTMGATVAGGWASGDIIYQLNGTSFTPFTYDGTNWKRSGNPGSQNTAQLLASDSGILVRKASATAVAESSPANN